MNKIEIDGDALLATIEVLWGPKMIPVADRVYRTIERVSDNAHRQGLEQGRAEGRAQAEAPPATLNPIHEGWARGAVPVPPEDLYGKDMWGPRGAKPQGMTTYDTNDGTFELQHDSGDEQPEFDPRFMSGRLGKEDVGAVGASTCSHDSALCSNFPGCGCIQ